MAFAAWRSWSWGSRKGRGSQRATSAPAGAALCGNAADGEEADGEEADVEALFEQMLVEGREALLLRPEVVVNLSDAQRARAQERLERAMSLVPEGEMVVGPAWRDEEPWDESEERGGFAVRVEAFLLDRWTVTNAQFGQFVAAGGYEQLAIWDHDVLPALMDFVDETGHPGPRWWRNGRFLPGTQQQPVVGVSWYEACAFARWVGKRLPTDPEWEKAASWPLQLSAAQRPQRRFPWGDVMDPARANLWHTGRNGPANVDEYPLGVSVGGVFQLVGNVWEWTTGNFGTWSTARRDLLLPVAMKSIRGGAYDTYLETQATCQFQSGEDPMARRHNIGFRCALSDCDLRGGGVAFGCEAQGQEVSV